MFVSARDGFGTPRVYRSILAAITRDNLFSAVGAHTSITQVTARLITILYDARLLLRTEREVAVLVASDRTVTFFTVFPFAVAAYRLAVAIVDGASAFRTTLVAVFGLGNGLFTTDRVTIGGASEEHFFGTWVFIVRAT
jgi:hypothetical protein